MDYFRFTIESLGGLCPLRGEGWIGDLRWYFRARHSHWQFVVGETTRDACDATIYKTIYKDKGWRRIEEWGDSEYAAGYMPTAIALQCIASAALEWADCQPKTTESKEA